MKKFCKFYELKKIATNALGEVYLSLTRDEKKEISPFMVVNLREEFNLERRWKALTDYLEFSKTLNHPNILRYDTWGECKQGRYVAARAKEYFSLGSIIKNLKKRNLPFTFDIPVHAILQIISGLQYLNNIRYKDSAIYHNILSPDEILINLDGVVYINNAGILQAISEDRKLAKDLIVERSTFLPKELIDRAKPSPKADVYSVASLLFFLTTGKYISPEKNIELQLKNTPLIMEFEGKKEIPEELQKILSNALAPEETRYQNIEILRSAFDDFITKEDISPTTFNLAYYMNTLFHDEVLEGEKLVKRESEKVPVEIVEEPIEKETEKEEAEKKKGFPMVAVIGSLAVILIAVIIAIVFMGKPKQPVISQAELDKRINQLVETKMKEREAELKKEYENKYGKISQQDEEKLKKQLEEERKKLAEKARAEELAKLRKIQQSKKKPVLPSVEKKVEKPKEEVKQEETKAEIPPQKTSEVQQQKKEEVEKKPAVETKPQKISAPVSKPEVIPGSVVPITELDSPLKLVKKIPPRIPERARRLRIRGSVMASIMINENGEVEQVRIIRGTPKGYFEKEAERTLSMWKFTPPRKKGVGVKVWKVVTIKF